MKTLVNISLFPVSLLVIPKNCKMFCILKKKRQYIVLFIKSECLYLSWALRVHSCVLHVPRCDAHSADLLRTPITLHYHDAAVYNHDLLSHWLLQVLQRNICCVVRWSLTPLAHAGMLLLFNLLSCRVPLLSWAQTLCFEVEMKDLRRHCRSFVSKSTAFTFKIHSYYFCLWSFCSKIAQR